MVNPTENKILEAVELARNSGKICRGTNEVTKTLERGQAKAVIVAKDVSPKEIVMHLPILAKEKNVSYFEVSSKDDLGAAAGLEVATASIAIINEGEAKKVLEELNK